MKYLLILSLPILAYVAFSTKGWLTYIPLIEAFVLIPLFEFLIPPQSQNISLQEEEKIANHPLYDVIIYTMFPIQMGLLFYYLWGISDPQLSTFDLVGRTLSMGLLCGVLGINVAHELGHRNKKHEQWMAKILLLTSLYMHFFIEHNFGHHKNVGTPEDPSTAKKNESLYAFWLRSIFLGIASAFRIEQKRIERNKNANFFHNQVYQFFIIQLGFVFLIFWFGGITATKHFLFSALIGILLLETVQYIEHYGLRRKKVSDKRYENANPLHSWNSNHILGRLFLFELSRHSDHHFQPHRKYQILKSHPNSPEMPTGYPGMMLLSLIPFAWFKIMNPKIELIEKA